MPKVLPKSRRASLGCCTKQAAARADGDGNTSISRTYTANGLPAPIVSGAATWSMAYNALRLPTTQVLTLNGQNYTFNHDYDATGHLAQPYDPTETNTIGQKTIAHTPNALWWPSQVGYSGIKTMHTIRNGQLAQIKDQTSSAANQFYALAS